MEDQEPFVLYLMYREAHREFGVLMPFNAVDAGLLEYSAEYSRIHDLREDLSQRITVERTQTTGGSVTYRIMATDENETVELGAYRIRMITDQLTKVSFVASPVPTDEDQLQGYTIITGLLVFDLITFSEWLLGQIYHTMKDAQSHTNKGTQTLPETQQLLQAPVEVNAAQFGAAVTELFIGTSRKRTQERDALIKEIKDENPRWPRIRVAQEVTKRIGEEITEEDVRNAYRRNGWSWQRADRIR
jgi:hypothetical protein